MLENSYDATGIKFGILVSNELPLYSDLLNSSDINVVSAIADKVSYSNTNTRFVDFSQIDGLKIKEVLELTESVQIRNAFIFAVYTNIEYISIGPSTGQKFSNTTIVKERIIFRDLEKIKEMTIDQLIENHIITNYDNSDEDKKRWMRCFLQRYRYGTQEKTNEFIKQKINRK